MRVFNKILLLLYFVFLNILDGVSSIRTNVINNDLNQFVQILRTFSLSNVDASSILLNPSNYVKYYSGLKNEDLYLNAPQLIKKYGYPVETHHVTTKDGYILTLFRIRCGSIPVLLFHGLLLSADDFIIAGPNEGLAYLLAAAGYDVWLANARGTKYSRRHETLNPDKDSKYWNFTFHEIGVIDTPTIIDYILDVTGYSKLIYIGHSQGTCIFFVMCSEYPEYNDKVYIMFAMAPVAYICNMKSPSFRALAYFVDEEYFLYKHLGYPNEVLPSNALTKAISGIVCGIAGLAVATLVCTNIAFTFFGYNYSLMNVTNIPNIAQHAPSGASVKQILHYFQEVNSCNFQQFDYGQKKNIQMYGNKTAPPYYLERVKAPVFIFYGDNDWLVDPKDAWKTRSQLQNVIEFYKVPYSKFNHLDYLWAINPKTLVYNKILKVLRKFGLNSKDTMCSKK
ncbi:lipase 3-like [Manduca sexta]|uniref:lipase 3-like n=1 Tax=Manduca sexta TaxID=7130 RepID=UPI00118417E6|nr:lipase 3-like [Manduca sexta]